MKGVGSDGTGQGPAQVNRSELSGPAELVQARDVYGGVHFHGEAAPQELPRQLPGDIRGFVNRVEEMRALNRLLTDGYRNENVTLSVITGTAGVGKPKPGL